VKLTEEQRADLLAERERAVESLRAAKAHLADVESRLAADRVARLAELDAQTADRDLLARHRSRESRRALDRQTQRHRARAEAMRRSNRDPNPPHWLDAHEDRHDRREEGVA